MKLEIFGIEGLGEIAPGDDIALAIHEALKAGDAQLLNGDVVVVTQKIVSKAEGRIVDVKPDTAAENSGTSNDPADYPKDPQAPRDPISAKLPTPSEVVARESVRILRRRGDLVISETSHGFVCANAGVDFSNVPAGKAALLPRHPDRSAQRIREGLRQHAGVETAVVVSDTFGRPWRRGLTDVAIGCSGILPILDLRGHQDALGRELAVTEVAIVDEIASAAELVMGKSANIPVAIIRGAPKEWLIGPEPTPGTTPGIVSHLVRHPSEDLFR